MRELSPKEKGIINEERCKLFFIERGYTVSVPIGDNARYDFILEYENKLYKIQCKCATPTDAHGVQMDISRNVSTMTKVSTYYYTRDEVDFFCTFVDGMCYLIPFDSCGSAAISLRFEPTSNKMYTGVRWAVDYEADYILAKISGKDVHPRRNMLAEIQELRSCPTIDVNNSQYGSRWITNGLTNKKYRGDGSDLPPGFRFGRVLNT